MTNNDGNVENNVATTNWAEIDRLEAEIEQSKSP